jgi:integrase
MRPGEVTALRTGDVDRSGPVWAFTPRDHKTAHRSRGRTVYLGPRAQEVLLPWLKADPDGYVFSPAEAEAARNAAKRATRRTPLSPSHRARKPKRSRKRAPGARYLITSYAHAVARGCDRAFPHPTLASVRKKDLTPEQREELNAWRRSHRWHPHQLRHAAATEIRARYGLEAAQLVLGHAQADVTQIYAERDLDRARAIMGEIG